MNNCIWIEESDSATLIQNLRFYSACIQELAVEEAVDLSFPNEIKGTQQSTRTV
jgi:hypothetical protein